MKNIFILVIFGLSLTLTSAKNSTRHEKLFSFLQVVNFPNSPCNAGARNGTCYTSAECNQRRGVANGQCANGFGVCCVFSIGCGQVSAENNTYLVLTSTTSPPVSNCQYTLCENNLNICRIRLDFQTFSIAGPAVGTTFNGANVPSLNNGGSIGQCVTDGFSISAPGNAGSPEICGFNSGQHMIVDSSQVCPTANFRFGSGASIRSYDIQITQYCCGDEKAGPPDCLQFFTSDTGTISSFNFALTAGNVPNTVTHLANQCYSMCFRRNVNKCAICFTPAVGLGAVGLIQESFGLSLSVTITSKSAVDNMCSHDYLIIPNGNLLGSLNMMVVARGADRFCGRFLNTMNGVGSSVTVCTTMRPFKLIFKTDAEEVAGPVGVATPNTDEQSGTPGGIIGFSLIYNQIGC